MKKPMVVIIQHDRGVDVRHTDDVTVLWVDDYCNRDRVYESSATAPLEALSQYVGPRKHWSSFRTFAPADPIAKKRGLDARDPNHPNTLYPIDWKPKRSTAK